MFFIARVYVKIILPELCIFLLRAVKECFRRPVFILKGDLKITVRRQKLVSIFRRLIKTEALPGFAYLRNGKALFIYGHHVPSILSQRISASA